MRPALLFYCQHSVGLGHLMRSYALCARLAERFRVVLVCGGALPRGDRAAARASRSSRCRRSASAPTGRFVSHDPRLRSSARGRRGASGSCATLRALRPAVVLVELFPFGRAKFAARARAAARGARASAAP